MEWSTPCSSAAIFPQLQPPPDPGNRLERDLHPPDYGTQWSVGRKHELERRQRPRQLLFEELEPVDRFLRPHGFDEPVVEKPDVLDVSLQLPR